MSSVDPFVVCTYGPSGIGKTTDMGYSFPQALFVAAPGALSSIESVCGYIPDRIEVGTIEEGTKLIERVGKEKKYRTVVFDDFSFLAQQTFSRLEAKLSGFKLWGGIRDQALEFRDVARYVGVNVALNCWEQPPRMKDGGRIRGGPKLSGDLPEQIPALCDMVLRAGHEPNRKPWPSVYRCMADASYVMKDRFDVAKICDPAPMNLGELLRAYGKHEVLRHVGLPDQEAQVASISQHLQGVPAADAQLANDLFRKLIENGMRSHLARWTIRDAMDRAVIREQLKLHSSSFV